MKNAVGEGWGDADWAGGDVDDLLFCPPLLLFFLPSLSHSAPLPLMILSSSCSSPSSFHPLCPSAERSLMAPPTATTPRFFIIKYLT